jgi:hypothetical protein
MRAVIARTLSMISSVVAVQMGLQSLFQRLSNERLDTRLRVHRHDHLPLRRIQVQTDDITDLVLKIRILGNLERPLLSRFQVVLPPQSRHPRLSATHTHSRSS